MNKKESEAYMKLLGSVHKLLDQLHNNISTQWREDCATFISNLMDFLCVMTKAQPSKLKPNSWVTIEQLIEYGFDEQKCCDAFCDLFECGKARYIKSSLDLLDELSNREILLDANAKLPVVEENEHEVQCCICGKITTEYTLCGFHVCRGNCQSELSERVHKTSYTLTESRPVPLMNPVHIPVGWWGVAMNNVGYWHACSKKPEIVNGAWKVKHGEKYYIHPSFAPQKRYDDYKESAFTRSEIEQRFNEEQEKENENH